MEKINAQIIGLYFFSVGAFSSISEISYIPKIIGILVVLMAIVDIIRYRWYKFNSVYAAYFLLGIWSFITFPFSKFYHIQIDSLLTFIQVNLISFAVIILIKNIAQVKTVLVFLMMSIIAAIYFNYNEFTTLIYLITENTETTRLAGTFANANVLAIYSITIALSSLLYINISNLNTIKIGFSVLSLIISLTLAIYSGSRKGIISVFIIVVFIGYFAYKKYSKKRFMKILSILLVFFFAFIGIYLIFNSPFYYRFETMFEGRDTSANDRMKFITFGIELWSKNTTNLIFGVGFDQFRFYNPDGFRAHNGFIEILASTGIVGVSFFIAMYYNFYSLLRRFKKFSINENDNINYYLFLIMIIIYLIFELTDTLISHRILMPLLMLFSNYLIILTSGSTNNLQKF